MRNSLADRFERSINKCDICFNPYNRNKNRPLIICSMHHTVCKECVDTMRHKPTCPFCRERIVFDKIVINNYIYELLPNQEVEPNSRQEVPEQFNNAPRQSYPQERPTNTNNDGPGGNINNRPLEHIYPPGYNDDVPEWGDDEYNDERMTDQHKTVIWIICCFQLPFTFFNLYLALTQPHSICMDQSQGMGMLVVRPWFLSMGITQVVLLFALVFPLLLHKCNCISFGSLSKWWMILAIAAMLKVMIWAVVELELFARVIAHFCTGGVFAYGLVLTILHSILLIGICCCTGGSRTGGF